MRVSELTPEERPREKLLAKGPAALSDPELLAVLLRTGMRGTPVLDLAREWLRKCGGLEKLVSADLGEILKTKGVGIAKGAIVAAALEVGRRVAERRLAHGPLLDRPEAVAEMLKHAHGHERVEVFGCITLDARNRLLANRVLHRGGRAHAPVEPAEVFNLAIRENAHGLIVWHTHPSGDPTPSEDDVALTRRLADAGKLLNIHVLDHLVIARGAYVSLRQRGLIS